MRTGWTWVDRLRRITNSPQRSGRRIAGRIRATSIELALEPSSAPVRLVDLSESGALFTADAAQAAGSRTTLTLIHDCECVTLQALVVRCRPRAAVGPRLAWTGFTSYEVAVVFASMPPSSRNLLAGIVAAASGATSPDRSRRTAVGRI